MRAGGPPCARAVTRVTDDVRSDNTTRSTDERAHNDDGALAGLDPGKSETIVCDASKACRYGTSRSGRNCGHAQRLNRGSACRKRGAKNFKNVFRAATWRKNILKFHQEYCPHDYPRPKCAPARTWHVGRGWDLRGVDQGGRLGARTKADERPARGMN